MINANHCNSKFESMIEAFCLMFWHLKEYTLIHLLFISVNIEYIFSYDDTMFLLLG